MRTEKLDQLVAKKCDTVFIISNADRPDRNIEYYSGMNSSLSSGAVLWKVGREPTLVTRDTHQKKKIKMAQLIIWPQIKPIIKPNGPLLQYPIDTFTAAITAA